MSKTASSRSRNVVKTLTDLEGSKLVIPKGFKGLGLRYYELLGQESNKILQVDTSAGITETKGSVKGRSIQLALEMKKRGIGESSIVVIISKIHASQTIAILATLFLGAIVAPLDSEFSNNECSDLLKKLKPKMCFCDTRPLSQVQMLLTNLKLNSVLVHFGVGENDGISFQSLFTHKEDDLFQPVSIANPHDTVAFILPTQGTTTPPKLVCLSHHNMYVQTKILLEIFNYPEKILSSFPLSWILQAVLACASFEAGTIRILSPVTITERNACKMIHDFEIGHAIFSVEYAMNLISNAGIKDYNLNCLKCVLLSAVNTRYEVHNLKKLLPHVSFLQCYYLTETGCIAMTTETNYSSSLDKPNSVGRLSLNSKIKIIDLDTRDILAQDNYGELYYSGDGMMLGYLKENEKTRLSIEKGFFKTGDMAMYDEDGWLYIKGRIEDLIVMDNYRLCPSELEDIVLAHPFVKDVIVVGNYKEIVACVVKNTDKSLSAEKLLNLYCLLLDLQKNQKTRDVTLFKILHIDKEIATFNATINIFSDYDTEPYLQMNRNVRKKLQFIKSLEPLIFKRYISDRVPESNRPTKIIFMDSFPRTSIGQVVKRKLRDTLLQINIGYATSLSSIPTVC